MPSFMSSHSAASLQSVSSSRRSTRSSRSAAALQVQQASVGGGFLDVLQCLIVVEDGLRDETKPWHRLAKWAEERTGVDRLKLFAVLVCALAVYLSTCGLGTSLLSDAIAFMYPAYVTVVTVTRQPRAPPGFGRLSDRRRWLTYWMTLVAVLWVERLLGGLLLIVVPHYCLVRSAFFMWCYAPVEFNGSAFIYAAVVRRLSVSRLAIGAHQRD